jgi:hypothetical protein
VLGVSGGALIVVEAIGRRSDIDLVLYGMVAMLAAIGLSNLIIIWATREPADVMFRDGYDLGYQAGLDAARRSVGANVVPLRRRDEAG